MEVSDKEFRIFKGLQKPLEFMGLQGRYIVWAAVGMMGNFLLFVIIFSIFSSTLAIILLLVSVLSTVAIISYNQKRGLYSKKRDKGIYIVNKIFH